MRVEIHTPAEVTEVSRALQAANQQRLASRQADGWAERDATRLVRKARALIDAPESRVAALDPWRGAVPEFEPFFGAHAPRLGKRFKIAGGYFQYISEDTLQVWTASKSASRDVILSATNGPRREIVLPIGNDRVMLVVADMDANGVCVTISKTSIRIRNSIPSQLGDIIYRFMREGVSKDFDYFRPALLQFFPPDNPDYPVVYVWAPLLKSYGFGHLVNRDANGQNPGWGWTPVIFSYLRNYRGEFHLVNGDTQMVYKAFDYKYIRDKYIPADAPPYFITSDAQIPNASASTRRNYYYFKPPEFKASNSITSGPLGPGGYRLLPKGPAGFSTTGTPQRPAVALLPNRGEYAIEKVRLLDSQANDPSAEKKDFWFEKPQSGLIPFVSWDWDRPLACWIELSRFGFTPSNLMLTAEESQALSDADWDEIGFKF